MVSGGIWTRNWHIPTVDIFIFMLSNSSHYLAGAVMSALYLMPKSCVPHKGYKGWVEQGLSSHQTHYRSYRGRIFTDQMTRPTVSEHWRKLVLKGQTSIPSGPPHRAHNNTTTMKYETKTHKIQTQINLCTVKWAQYDNFHRTVRTAHICVAYRCAQLSYTTQHGAVLIIFPLNLQSNITAQILSTGEKVE